MGKYFIQTVFGFRLFTPKKKRGHPKNRRPLYYLIPKALRWRLVLVGLVLLFSGYGFLVMKLATQLPSPTQLTSTQRPLTTQILDRHGQLLFQFYEGRNSKPIKLEELPSSLVDATIAIEDKHFFTHPGIDPLGVARAFIKDLTSHRNNSQDEGLQGGSTITQQLIKNTLLTPDQTITRKIKEAVLAFWAERIYSKKEILQMYFNEAPYGGPAWGIEAAAEMYFGKQAKDLNLAESSYLAGLPAAPTQYSPYGIHPEQGKQRQSEVLRRMVEDGYITRQQADESFKQQLSFRPPTQDIRAPHFVMYIRSLLASKYGERVVSQGGLKVTTTLDLNIQEMAQSVVAEQIAELADLKVGNGAAMVTDAQTGEILAMVGSKNYFDSTDGNFNVTLALRQPGSSIKPITYATAFKEGFTPGTVVLDSSTTFTNPWGQGYSPVNYDSRFHGPVTLRTALGSSYNIPAVKVLAMVGIPAMVETAREMGITTFDQPENYGLSLTLGAGAVRMIDMMSVYGTLAAGGIRHDPNPILEVTDNYGNVLEDHRKVDGKKVLTEEVAYLLTNILSDNNARTPAFGPNSQLVIPNQTVAVKTGTSDDKRDNWAFGYTPQYVVGAWVGNNDYSPMDQRLASGITGATPIWHDIMDSLLTGQADLGFKRPSGIIETTIGGHRDLAISGKVPKTVVGFQSQKEAITYSDPVTAYTADQTQTTQ
ncbi:MAG: PBP1A family penicillin-binding protein [Patescibacteria group bacterium]|nr:PBP1A family penicillin-binding protein [Patescibacteria group bacterium]